MCDPCGQAVHRSVFRLACEETLYCATDDEDDIENGTAMVKQILAENYVRPDEAEKIKAKIRERG